MSHITLVAFARAACSGRAALWRCRPRRLDAAPRFYPRRPDCARARIAGCVGRAAPYEIGRSVRDDAQPVRHGRLQAVGSARENVNTIDEVPDSSWFTNRIGTRPLTDRRDRPRSQRRVAARSVALGAPRQEVRRRPSRDSRRRTQTAKPGSSRSTPPGTPKAPPPRCRWRRSSSGRSATTRSNAS